MSDDYFYNLPTGFVVFNNQELAFAPITPEDLISVEGPSAGKASAVWSSGCEWYFVVELSAISLWNVYSSTGLQCLKKSATFIEACLDNGLLSRSIQRTRRKPR